MASYVAVTRLNGTDTEGAQRKSKGEAIEDALAVLRENQNVEVSLQRWDSPRVGNRGQLDSVEAESGAKYDLVELEVFSRRQV